MTSELADAIHVADNHQPGRDANSELRSKVVPRPERRGLFDNLKAGLDCPFRIVLLRLREAEIDQHSVTEKAGWIAAKLPHHRGHHGKAGGEDVAHVLGIEP